MTFWGKSDATTWLTSSTRVDGPLLFDVSFKKKHAYWAVVDPLQFPGADLSTAMTAAPMTVPAGQAVAYTITVTNNADTDTATFKPTDDDLPAANVSLTTAVPAHTVFQSLTGARRLVVRHAGARRHRAGAVHRRVAAGRAPPRRSR